MVELSTLSMTDIIRLQNQLQQELTRRFERKLVLLFSDIVGSTGYFAQWGDAAGRQLQQLPGFLDCRRTPQCPPQVA